MRSVVLALAAACAFGAAGPAGAEGGVDGPTMDEVGLEWRSSPSPARMSKYYPRRARTLRMRKGMATVACTPDAKGRLDCEAVTEDPQDYGFGAAAVDVMRPATVAATDGGSPEGRRFLFTLRFGKWLPSDLPPEYGELENGLKFTRLPPAVYFSGQPRGVTWTAELACTAHADGTATCEVDKVDTKNQSFADSALKAMRFARVTTRDGGSAEGRTFRYVYSWGTR